MPDLVVTVPKTFGLDRWIEEGDPAGTPWTGEEWGFYTWGVRPTIEPGERVYIVFNSKLRGYAPLIRLVAPKQFGQIVLVRGGGAEAVTIKAPIRGFRGWRPRWWDRDIEIPFPDWKTP